MLVEAKVYINVINCIREENMQELSQYHLLYSVLPLRGGCDVYEALRESDPYQQAH